MKFSNELEKYEIEVTKMGHKNPLFLTVPVRSLHLDLISVPNIIIYTVDQNYLSSQIPGSYSQVHSVHHETALVSFKWIHCHNFII